MPTYSDKLKDPRWQKRRLEILERDKWTCQECGETHKTLTVHHRYYEKDKEPWEASEEALTTLCEICHDCKKYLASCAVCGGTDSIVIRTKVKDKKRKAYFFCAHCGLIMNIRTNDGVWVPALTLIDVDIISPEIFSVHTVPNTTTRRRNHGQPTA